MTRLVVRGGRVIDPAEGLDRVADVLIEDGRVRGVGPAGTPADQVIDARGRWVVPGLIDMHVHLREPGQEEVETIASGCEAAVRGGFTTVVAMPNTDPAVDSEASAEFVILQAARAARARVLPVGAITKGRRGEELSEMAGLVRGGAVAFSDDGSTVRSAEVMRQGLLYARMLGRPVIAHQEDADLNGGGVMHAGRVSVVLGLPGKSSASEEITVARDIKLAEVTGAHLHCAHVSTAGTVDLVRRAKARGLRVTAEVTPHHLSLTDECVRGFDSVYKMCPPLRTAEDVEALREGLRDGTIDAIASDHAPHSPEEKEVEFSLAPDGVIGLETTLGVVLTDLVHEGRLGPARAIEAMTAAPARILGIQRGTLRPGCDADLTVIDPELRWEVDPSRFASKSRNCPFAGRTLTGRAVSTVVGGRVVWTLDGVRG
ncbi:MAG: dihydroorotase [Planctomycetes bacterium]|nr:dihydroorotase [Planctomycetota bacterium]